MESLMISCREATLAIIKKEERKISFSERIKLALHLMICSFCKFFEKQNKFLSVNIKNISSEEPLSGAEQEEMDKKLNELSK